MLNHRYIVFKTTSGNVPYADNGKVISSYDDVVLDLPEPKPGLHYTIASPYNAVITVTAGGGNTNVVTVHPGQYYDVVANGTVDWVALGYSAGPT